MTDPNAFEALLSSDPARAQQLLARLAPYVVKPHAAQEPVVRSPARFKVLNCGRRWGKTKIGVKLMLDEARAKPNSLIWWVAPTYRVVKRGYRETLRQLPRDFLTHDPPPDTNFDAGRPVVLKLKNGTNIEFYSAERPGGMLGEGVDFVVDGRGSHDPVERVGADHPSDAGRQARVARLLISTPRGRNWFYKRWLAGQDNENSEWDSWTFPSWTNPHLESSEIQAMKDELPALVFAQEVEAKFLAAGSSVFRWEEKSVQYDQVLDNGFIEDVPPKGHVFLGVDLAKTTDYTVFYGTREYDSRNCYYEKLNDVSWPEQKRRLKRAVRQLYKAGATAITLIMDSTGVGDPIVEDMEEAGYDVVPVNFTTLKNKMVVLFAKDLEEGRAFILDQGDLVEFENYAMNMSKAGRMTYSAPEGEHDDAVSAKILSHWGLVNEGAPNITHISDAEGDPAPESAPRTAEDEAGEEWDDLLDEDWQYSNFDGEAYAEPAATEKQTPQRALTPEEIFKLPGAWN